MKKKILGLILTCVLCLSVCACGTDPELAKFKSDIDNMCNDLVSLNNKMNDIDAASEHAVEELLEYLEQIDLPRIVASSSPKAMIERNLQTTGTARYFHDVVCGYDVDKCKPDPAIFLEAARRIGVDIHDCLVLEDSHNGVRAGHASGAVTVMVPDLMPVTGEMKTLYDFCCKDLYEVRALMEAGTI